MTLEEFAKEVNISVERLVNLTELYCSYTQVTSIPSELVNLTELYCNPLYIAHSLKKQRIYGFKYREAFTLIGIPVNCDENEIIKCAYAIISVLDKEDALQYFMSEKDYEFIKRKLGL